MYTNMAFSYWALKIYAKHFDEYLKQSSQVDLLAKREIFEGVAVVCDAAVVTPLGRSGGMLPQDFDNWK